MNSGRALEPEDFTAWLRLLETPGVGREGARRLLAAFGSPQAVFDAPPAALKTVVDAASARALGEPPPEFGARLAAARAWLRGGPSRHVVTLGDPAYPLRLLQAPDPPLLLYVEGDLSLLSAPSVAIVGSRAPTPQGLANAREFALQLSRRGLVVVSGLALGVDGAAHTGALEGQAEGGGATVAVVGTGLDVTYPKRHQALAARIAAGGALVSEFAPGTPPLPEHFPQRNRIIAGLAMGTLVVEAALKSGSLITARLAVEAGREVFAIPGSIHSAQAQGCHALIRQGAALVESADEVADAVLAMSPRLGVPTVAADSAAAELPDEGGPDPILDALGHDPTHLDALIARTGWPSAELLARLLELELQGRVARLPGGLFQRIAIA